MYRRRHIVNSAFHAVDRGCIGSPLLDESDTDDRMPNGGRKMDSKSKQKKQREEPPPDVGNEDRIEAKIDRDLQDSFPASDPPGWVLGVEPPPAEKEEKDDSSSSAATGDTGGG
jgi:hypothetical protein